MATDVVLGAATIAVGLAVGWLMARVWRGQEGVVADLVLGALGGAILGWLARRSSVTADGVVETAVGAVIGAAGLVTLYRALNRV